MEKVESGIKTVLGVFEIVENKKNGAVWLRKKEIKEIPHKMDLIALNDEFKKMDFIDKTLSPLLSKVNLKKWILQKNNYGGISQNCFNTNSVIVDEPNTSKIRLAIGLFHAEGLNQKENKEFLEELKRYIETEIMSKAKGCADFLKYIPNEIQEDFHEFDNRNLIMEKEYAVIQGKTSVPKSVNYILSIGFKNRVEYDPVLLLRVSRSKDGVLEFLTRTYTDSDYKLSNLRNAGNLKSFAQKAVNSILTTSNFRSWLIDEGISENSLSSCY
jgi:hypothetical protein